MMHFQKELNHMGLKSNRIKQNNINFGYKIIWLYKF